MKKIIYAIALTTAFACNKKMERKEIAVGTYPQTKQDSTVDNYSGTKVADPYRWLENDTATDVRDWVKSENKITHDYLNQIPFREKIKTRLTEIWNFPKYSAPFKEGEYYFFFKNNPDDTNIDWTCFFIFFCRESNSQFAYN